MMDKTLKAAGFLMTAALLTGVFAPAQASGELPIFKACLAKAETAKDPKFARDECFWEHWDLMAEAD